MKKLLLSAVAFLFIGNLSAQNVNIPDANFKASLVANTSINTNNDTEIQVSEATAYNGVIGCDNLSISDLTGIEAFTAITFLTCNSNSLSSLDVSANTALTVLRCASNNLSSLDLSTNTALTNLHCYSNNLASLDLTTNTTLTYVRCYSNSLTSLDVSASTDLIDLRCYFNNLTSLNVSTNTALTYLNCFANSLSSLDVTANTALSNLYCQSNSLTSIDVSNNTALTIFYCSENSLSNVDVSANTGLTNLNCSENSLSSLDVSTNTALTYVVCHTNSISSLNVSANSALSSLQCSSNSLTSLDLSTNTALTNVSCFANNLSSLDVSNGNNTNMAGANFNAANNPNLSCIKVDDTTYSAANWTSIDPASNFTENAFPIVDAGMNQTVCDGELVTIAGSGASTYVWNNGVIDNIAFAASVGTTTYTVMGTDIYGCVATDTVDLVANALPDNTTSTVGFTISANQLGASYQWVDCNNSNAEIVGEINASYTATAIGDYAVIVIMNGCSDTSACVNVSTVGVGETENISQVSIYPNPTQNNFNIDLGEAFTQVNIQILDLSGRVVYQTTTNKQVVNLNFKAPKGIYFVRVNRGDNQSTIKLIKQ
jgi:Leucine-rich repeat (LRR) protein